MYILIDGFNKLVLLIPSKTKISNTKLCTTEKLTYVKADIV